MGWMGLLKYLEIYMINMCIETMRPDWGDCIAADHNEARSDYVGGCDMLRHRKSLI